jgi:HD-GYP domain-containing protein (c-di-GMP phosphodiesterase class II)
VLRRLLSRPETAPEGDRLDAALRVMRAARPQERSKAALEAATSALSGDVRGYVVRGDDASGYAFDAQVGYDDTLLDVEPGHGPWRTPGPRLVSNLVAEMFTPNDAPKRAQYTELGLRDATATLVVPVSGNFVAYGSMVLHRHGSPGFTDDDLKQAARWGALLGEAQSQAHEMTRAKHSLVEFTRAFTQAFEAQDFAQLGHAERVTAYALALGRALGLSSKQQADVYFAAMLHDIGKLGSGLDLRLEDLEHPQRGANMVASAAMLKEAAEGIRHHHEAWDGSGFPSGLRKDGIPLLARIVAVADTFDVLSSERGQALPLRDVEKALEARAGRELDPQLVSLFVGNVLRQGKDTAELGKLQETDLPF